MNEKLLNEIFSSVLDTKKFMFDSVDDVVMELGYGRNESFLSILNMWLAKLEVYEEIFTIAGYDFNDENNPFSDIMTEKEELTEFFDFYVLNPNLHYNFEKNQITWTEPVERCSGQEAIQNKPTKSFLLPVGSKNKIKNKKEILLN